MAIDDARLPTAEHDALLTWAMTERGAIETRPARPQAGGVPWDRVRPDWMAALPFLAELKRTIPARRVAG